MSRVRPLQGGCQCGRNRYVVDIPQDTQETPLVVFDSGPSHRTSQAAPLAAFIRVPLSWYRSCTIAFFPDEEAHTIRRVYTHPSTQASKQTFCGYCGTPLGFWSEEPRSEADFIQLALGSLKARDLGDLEEMGLIPEPAEEQQPPTTAGQGTATPTSRETTGIHWFDNLIAGSRLGELRTSKGSSRSRDGTSTVEWEIHEWTAGDGDGSASPAKRVKLVSSSTGDAVMSDDAQPQ